LVAIDITEYSNSKALRIAVADGFIPAAGAALPEGVPLMDAQSVKALLPSYQRGLIFDHRRWPNVTLDEHLFDAVNLEALAKPWVQKHNDWLRAYPSLSVTLSLARPMLPLDSVIDHRHLAPCNSANAVRIAIDQIDEFRKVVFPLAKTFSRSGWFVITLEKFLGLDTADYAFAQRTSEFLRHLGNPKLV